MNIIDTRGYKPKGEANQNLDKRLSKKNDLCNILDCRSSYQNELM